jgi:hypothetical protein
VHSKVTTHAGDAHLLSASIAVECAPQMGRTVPEQLQKKPRRAAVQYADLHQQHTGRGAAELGGDAGEYAVGVIVAPSARLRAEALLEPGIIPLTALC